MINLRDSCLKNKKKGDSKLFRPNSTHEEKSAIQESICHIGGRLWMHVIALLYHSTCSRNQAKMNFDDHDNLYNI